MHYYMYTNPVVLVLMTMAKTALPPLCKYKKHTHTSIYLCIHVNSNPASNFSNLVDVNHNRMPTGSRLYDS